MKTYFEILIVLSLLSSPALAQQEQRDAAPAATTQPATQPADATTQPAEATAEKPAAATKGPPLPFHTIEGYGGGAITPMAYLVNPGGKDKIFGYPAFALSYVNLGSKNLEAFTATETVFNRIELGYGVDRLGLGSLPDDIRKATGVNLHDDDVYLQNFNIRGLLLEENSFNLPLPALTAGVHFKENDDIQSIDHQLGGALSNIGLDKSNGTDFTLTASKSIVNSLTLKRPLILTAGLRNSDAAQLGFLGFGTERATTFEGSVAYVPFDWLLIAYEFRQKANPYDEIPGLVGEEDNWNAIDVSWIINSHSTLVAGYGHFGNLANADANGAWWLQFKYEF